MKPKLLPLTLTIFLLMPLAFTISDTMIQINNFFENQEYRFYSYLINFIVFFTFFSAVSILGLKNYYKSLNPQTKAVGLIIGLSFAFALTTQGYSIIVLFEYIKVIAFILLIAFVYFLLNKKIKNKALNLIASVLVVLFLFIVFSFLSNPGETSLFQVIIDSLNKIEI